MAMYAASAHAFRFEGYTLDLTRSFLQAGDHEIELRPQSFEVLRYLVENNGRLISKEGLIKAVWPSVTVADESLTRCVSDVRLALRDVDQRIIKTVPRRGYLFAPPVSAIAPAGSLVSGREAPMPTQTAVMAPRPRPRLSLVVLPFVSLSGDPAQDCLADVITEALTAHLSRIRDSLVIARTTRLHL